MLTIYGIKNCSTCVKALKWLTAQGVQHQFIDYRVNPIDPQLLQQWSVALGGWPKLVNRASMTWRNLDESVKSPESDADWLALIADHPTLVRRPVTVKETGEVMVGFKEDKLQQFLA